MSTATTGTLYLVPAPLDFGSDAEVALTEVLPDGTLRQAAQLTHWICENAKSCRAYLKRIADLHPLALPLQQQQITELPREVHKKGDHGAKGSASFDARALLAPLLAGQDMASVLLAFPDVIGVFLPEIRPCVGFDQCNRHHIS